MQCEYSHQPHGGGGEEARTKPTQNLFLGISRIKESLNNFSSVQFLKFLKIYYLPQKNNNR